MAVQDRFTYQDLEGYRVGRFNWGINTSFIVYRIGGTVVDTGSSNQWDYVRAFIEEKPLEQLLLTHHHEDHAGNAGPITDLTGVRPLAPDYTIQKIRHGYKTPWLQKLIWGSPTPSEADPLPEKLSLANGEPVKAIFTPGHAKDMTCYLLEERGWLFSADLYLANRLMMLRVDEDVPTIIDSTRKVLSEDFDVILCPHRGVVEQGKSKLQEKLDYLLNLSEQSQTLHREGVEPSEIAKRLLGPETLMSYLSGFNFCKRNLVESCLRVAL